MKIWLVADNIDESSGGPPRSISGLAEGLSMIDGFDVTVIASASNRPIKIDSVRVVNKVFLEDRGRLRKFLGISYIKFLLGVQPACRPDIVHVNSLWPQALIWYYIFSLVHGIPIVLSPRGTLSDWALGYKAWKKNLGMTFYRIFLFRKVKLFVASSNLERSDILKNIKAPNVEIVPNPLRIDAAYVRKLKIDKERSPGNVMLFLGRINPIKRVDHLVDCFIKANPKDWKLIIAGPDEQGSINTIMDSVTQSGLRSKIFYVGSVAENSEDKLTLFANADVVVLPSYSENFGVVIAESLACGIPVVATKGTPWESIITNNCGWYIDDTQEAMISTIKEIKNTSKADLISMGKRGEHAVFEFQSYAVAKVMAENYERILEI
jgi:glycosyltransferase involved in cell wall biosynthesis